MTQGLKKRHGMAISKALQRETVLLRSWSIYQTLSDNQGEHGLEMPGESCRNLGIFSIEPSCFTVRKENAQDPHALPPY